MVYQGMDSNGNPLEKVVYIPPNTSLHHIPSNIPIWYIENVPEGYGLSCEIAGWCFFEAMDVLGVLSPDGQPVAAMYADLGTCVITPPIVIGTTGEEEPVGDECTTNSDCGDGYTCNESGNCIPTDGSDDCDCDPGVECDEEGNCIEDIGCTSGLITSFLSSGQSNPHSFSYNFGGDGILRIQFKTYAKGDRLQVTVNGTPYNYNCTVTGQGWHNPDYEIAVSGETNITIHVISDCEESVDAFNWSAWCGANFDDGDDSSFTGGEDGENISLYPNPFTSGINLAFNNGEAAFSGTIKLMNAQGIEVMNMDYDFVEGENNLLLEGADYLQPGLYTVIIVGNNGLIGSKNLIKM